MFFWEDKMKVRKRLIWCNSASIPSYINIICNLMASNKYNETIIFLHIYIKYFINLQWSIFKIKYTNLFSVEFQITFKWYCGLLIIEIHEFIRSVQRIWFLLTEVCSNKLINQIDSEFYNKWIFKHWRY